MSQQHQITYQQEIYRKLIHVSSLWMPCVVYFFDQTVALSIFAICGLCVLILDIMRRKNNFLSAIINRYFLKMLRADEAHGSFRPSGAFYVMLGAFLSTLLFSKMIAVAALVMMLTGDAAAALIGRRFGKIKIMDKTVEGTSAFFVTAIAATWFFVGLTTAIAGATAGACAELVSKKLHLDDNVLIPLAAGVAMTYLL